MPVWPTLPWPALIFWAAIVGGFVASGFGLVRRQPSLLIGGAILLLPASLYLTAMPRFQYVGLVPVACVLLGAYAVRRDRVWIGGLLIAGTVVFWSVVASNAVVPDLVPCAGGGHRHRARGRTTPELEGAGLRPGRDRRGVRGGAAELR